MDGMANFDISAEEEQMLLDMDDQTNSSPSGTYINMTGLTADPRNYSLSGNFCNRVRIS